jgi:ABC-2 type transport system permease protein
MMSAGTMYLQQLNRAWTIARKDIRIYYLKGPVMIFGIIFPVFLFLSFIIGRELTLTFVMPGLLGMVLFFTSTAISPVVIPWETQARTLERLMSCPVTIPTIILGDILASFIFGVLISLIPVIVGLALGMAISYPLILVLGIILASFCFSSLGLIFSSAPTNIPSNIMMLSSLIKFPLIFISGIFIPLNELPAWGRGISYLSPLTYFTDIARHLIEKRGYLPIAVDILLLLALTALYLSIAAGLHLKTMSRRI